MLSKLICQEKDRFDIHQTLNHNFFKLGEINEGDCEMDDSSLPSSNLQEFNKRTLDIKTKTWISSPFSSPLVSKYSKLSPQNILRFEPALDGFSQTYKMLRNETDEENLESDIDDNGICPNRINLNLDVSRCTAKLLETKKFSN